nr:darcynin family protein [Pseudolysobacter antarcticus]
MRPDPHWDAAKQRLFRCTPCDDACRWRDHHAYELLVKDRRETPFRDRYFAIVEILPGGKYARAKNYHRAPLAA